MTTEFTEIPGYGPPEGARAVWLKTSKNLNIRLCLIPALSSEKIRGTVLICPGRTEFIEKYFDVAREVQARGFAAVIIDWPGQGLSDRLLGDRLKGHIDHFNTFTELFSQIMAEIPRHDMPEPYLALAHSMGGAITLSALLQNQITLKAAAFCAPMWGIKRPFSGFSTLVKLMQILGRSKAYATKPGPPETFTTNIVTYDEPLWQMNRDLTDKNPDLELGPVTWGWLAAALKVIDSFAHPDALKSLTIPIMVASAAHEKLVDNASHARIANLLPDCEHIEIDAARHELLMEKLEKRNIFWQGFDRLLLRAGV